MDSCRSKLYASSIGLLAVVVGGCNLRQGIPVAPEQTAQVRVYQSNDLAALKYTKLGPVDASACKMALWDDPPTEQGVTDQLRAKASGMSANGIANVSCESGTGAALVRDCWSRVACTADAIKVGD
jgi:hypothetical protein